MKRFVKADILGVRVETTLGKGGWISLSNSQAVNVMGAVSKAGQSVSQQSVLRLSADWACVARTSGLIGSLPGALYERQSDGCLKKNTNDLSRILAGQPNTGYTGFEFWEGNTAQILLQGITGNPSDVISDAERAAQTVVRGPSDPNKSDNPFSIPSVTTNGMPSPSMLDRAASEHHFSRV